MSAAADAYQALRAALGAMEGLALYEPGDPVDPPGVVLMPPELVWATGCATPTTARLLAIVVMPRDEQSLQRLLDVTPRVAEAVDQADGVDAVVERADPGSYTAGRDELPAYVLTVEIAL